jgi:hypothetical protein
LGGKGQKEPTPFLKSGAGWQSVPANAVWMAGETKGAECRAGKLRYPLQRVAEIASWPAESSLKAKDLAEKYGPRIA